MTGRPRVVLLGMMTKIPVAGVVWQTMHYLLGFQRLGWDVCYVEAHARAPSMLMDGTSEDGSREAASFLAALARRFGFGGRWAYQALHADGSCFGMSRTELDRLYRSAAMIVNLHGGTQPLEEHSRTGRLVYLETDPVQLQVELHDGVGSTYDFLDRHQAFFTFGENYGGPDCGLPVSDRYDFRPTRQPVCTDAWEGVPPPPAGSFTTVGNWRQHWRDVRLRGETYSWSKEQEFRAVLDLPRRTGQPMELALGSYGSEDRDLLEAHGWAVRDASGISGDADAYRRYIQGSRGEFTVAKDQNVRLRTGWFSDRSATYLAAGRPVVTQDTAFSSVLPTGVGLLPFTDVDSAAAAVEEVNRDYARHAAAAAELAREHFEAERVLARLLDDLGLRSAAPGSAAVEALPATLDLSVSSRRPLVLPTETVATITARPLPACPTRPVLAPLASVIVPVHGQLALTRLCVESLLSATEVPSWELVVVDDASPDATSGYLADTAARCPQVRLLQNPQNVGFARSVNRGIAAARGEVLVLLNSDAVVAPGWLAGLSRHLEDPTLGLIGAVTNEAPNEARVPVGYRTYGEYVEEARARAVERVGEARALEVATMFCVALRRAVHEQVGPLDERFEVGMFEDDDYSRRVHATGMRVACAEDVLVHHYGEGTLGNLVPTGEHGRVFRANRRRLEEKWGAPWVGHARREDPGYRSLVARVRHAVAQHVPADAGVAVITRGDESLLDLGGRRAWHLPQAPDGTYAGHHPRDSTEAIEQVRAARRGGARYLVVPVTAAWWLDHYRDLEGHLAGHDVAVDDDCAIFSLEDFDVA